MTRSRLPDTASTVGAPRLDAPTVDAWFRCRGWEPLPFQREVWQAVREGRSGLLHSGTGTGKTLAVWLGFLQTADPESTGLQAIWLTPLRALAGDTLSALRETLDDLGFERWRVESRTGDTSSHLKAKQLRETPHVLVTTPESLSLMLANAAAQTFLGDLKMVVVDEWHELMGSKRGVQTELALARLRRWNEKLTVWGLSATLGNTEAAARVLIPDRKSLLVRGEVGKETAIDSLLPETVDRFPWAGHLGLQMAGPVVEELERVGSVLLFTNTRAQAEIWHREILRLKPKWAGQVGLHHGSLDLEVRREVEEGLKSGRLRAVVATSSLDLGVDFSPVERVFQIGSPKGVARLLQRAGRSGHRPGETSRVTCVPTHALELVDIAAARNAARAGRIESRPPVAKPLDVLAQHLVTVALGGGFEGPELLAEVRTTAAYADLTDQEWGWAIDFVTRGGQTLAAYPEYRKVVFKNGRYTVDDRRTAQRHRMNIGTIVSDAAMQVQFLKGGRIGTIEESFVSRLKKGDRFAFGGKVLEFVMVKDMTCWVRSAKGVQGTVPRWAGGRMPLSNELASAAREVLGLARDGILDGPEMELAAPMLRVQQDWSAIPGPNDFLVEQVSTREGHHTFLFPFQGRQVHEGLAALLAFRLSRDRRITISMAVNDYGIELLSSDPVDFESELRNGILDATGVAGDILSSLNVAEMAKRQFREIARVSGLVVQTVPGRQKTARQIQASAGLLYDVFAQFDPDHPLLRQAQREVLERSLEQSALVACLERLASSRLVLTKPPKPTPFAFPILVDRLRQTVSSESLEDRIQRMAMSLEKAAG